MSDHYIETEKYIVHDGENNYEPFEDYLLAVRHADKVIGQWRDLARIDGEWPEEVERVFIAKVVSKIRLRYEEAEHEGDPETVDYHIVSRAE